MFYSDESQSINGNQEFMINLITKSLLGDNILHTFLQKAIECKFLNLYIIKILILKLFCPILYL